MQKQNKDLKLSIIVADDIVINTTVMEVNLNQISVPKSVKYCFNGQDAFKAAVDQIEISFGLQKLKVIKERVVI